MELSRALPERERKELLRRVSRSSGFQSTANEAVYPGQLTETERSVRIARDMERLTWLQRVMFTVLSLVSPASDDVVFIRLRLGDMRRRIRRNARHLVRVDRGELDVSFARRCYDLYMTVSPLIPVFQAMWSNAAKFREAIDHLVESLVPDPKHDLFDLITVEELETVYASAGSVHALREAVLKRHREHVESIPEAVFRNVQHAVLPFYRLRHIVLFPYRTVFQLFGVFQSQFSPTAYPPFAPVAAVRALEVLQRLLFAVRTATRWSGDPAAMSRFIRYFTQEPGAPPQEKQAAAEEAQQLVRTMLSVRDQAEEFYEEVPLPDIIRYYRSDPYFRLYVYPPSLDAKTFYSAYARVRFLAQIDERREEIQKRVLRRRIAEVFQGRRLEPFEYYRAYPGVENAAGGVPGFSYVQALNLLHNYLTIEYRRWVGDMITVLSRLVLRNNRVFLNRLLHYTSNMQDLADKIMAHDQSLSPDEDDGKAFIRLRQRLATDLTYLKLYRGLVQEKSQEALSLAKRGIEYLSGLRALLDDILISPVEHTRQQLNLVYPGDRKRRSIHEVLRDRKSQIHAFITLEHQVLEFEKGASL